MANGVYILRTPNGWRCINNIEDATQAYLEAVEEEYDYWEKYEKNEYSLKNYFHETDIALFWSEKVYIPLPDYIQEVI